MDNLPVSMWYAHAAELAPVGFLTQALQTEPEWRVARIGLISTLLEIPRWVSGFQGRKGQKGQKRKEADDRSIWSTPSSTYLSHSMLGVSPPVCCRQTASVSVKRRINRSCGTEARKAHKEAASFALFASSCSTPRPWFRQSGILRYRCTISDGC